MEKRGAPRRALRCSQHLAALFVVFIVATLVSGAMPLQYESGMMSTKKIVRSCSYVHVARARSKLATLSCASFVDQVALRKAF